MLKKAFATLCLSSLLLLSGCFGSGGGGQTEVPANYKLYDGPEYSFVYFQDWEIIPKDQLLTEFPKNTDIAVRNNLKDTPFITNVTVTKNAVAEGVNALAYGRTVLNQHKAGVVNFKVENQEEIMTKVQGEDVPSLYLTFTGKTQAQRDSLRFFQKFIVRNNTAYIVTLTTSLNESDLVLEKAKNVMKSFNVK